MFEFPRLITISGDNENSEMKATNIGTIGRWSIVLVVLSDFVEVIFV